jgi:hypothetical protein
MNIQEYVERITPDYGFANPYRLEILEEHVFPFGVVWSGRIVEVFDGMEVATIEDRADGGAPRIDFKHAAYKAEFALVAAEAYKVKGPLFDAQEDFISYLSETAG